MLRQRPGIPGRSKRRHEYVRQHSNNRLSQMAMLMDNPVNQAAMWSEEAFSLEDLSANRSLPQIVRCCSRLLPGEEQSLPVNIHVPMLLCEGRSNKKLLAKHVSVDARTQKLTETDDTIVIPGDYEGNFLRLQARTTKDQSVMKSLTQIAKSQAPAFLSLSPITVFFQTDMSSELSIAGSAHTANGTPPSIVSSVDTKLSRTTKTSKSSIVQRRVLLPPGSVFLITGLSKGLAQARKKSREVTLLRCTDPNGNAMLIAADQPGEFVEVEPPVGGGSKLSMRSSELMEANKYPSLVRFVYGDHIPRLTPCSYMFTLVDTFTEDSLIGCLLYPNHAIMIELPAMSSLRFQVALNTEQLLPLQLPKHAQEVVATRRDSFMTDLKLKCKFMHRVSPGEGFESMDELQSATVRTRQYANEGSFYL